MTKLNSSFGFPDLYPFNLTTNKVMDNFFTEISNQVSNLLNLEKLNIEPVGNFPKHDIYQKEDEMLIVLDIPTTYDKSNIKVELKKNILFITGAKCKNKYEGYNAIEINRKSSSFSKSFYLDENVIDLKNVNVKKFENGVLEISIPLLKKEEPKEYNKVLL